MKRSGERERVRGQSRDHHPQEHHHLPSTAINNWQRKEMKKSAEVEGFNSTTAVQCQ